MELPKGKFQTSLGTKSILVIKKCTDVKVVDL